MASGGEEGRKEGPALKVVRILAVVATDAADDDVAVTEGRKSGFWKRIDKSGKNLQVFLITFN